MLSEHRTKAGLTSCEGRGIFFFPWFEKGILWGGLLGWDDQFLFIRSPRRDLSLNPPSVV